MGQDRTKVKGKHTDTALTDSYGPYPSAVFYDAHASKNGNHTPPMLPFAW